MNKKLKAKWVRALPKHRRIQEKLTDGKGGYCPMGVLAKVAGIKPQREATMLSDASLKKVGLTRETQSLIAAFNDGEVGDVFPKLDESEYPKYYRQHHGATFKHMAEWIKENL